MKAILNYSYIHSLMNLGNGYKKIARITGYNVGSCKEACKRIRRKFNLETLEHKGSICEITGLKKTTMYEGRIGVLVKGHPRSNNRGYILRSRYIVEMKIGRYLESWEEVHHKDEIITNDDIDNLEVMTTSEHAKYHADKRKMGA